MNNLKEKRSAMTAMIEDWQSSGKSKKQYCQEKGINKRSFIIDIHTYPKRFSEPVKNDFHEFRCCF